jgi:MerR family transcriptional regulator, light-induced transcriptional regulator
MNISHTPSFNLKAVLQETGITADTLRAWERRYGLPLPDRTPGGHRLYSQHDIETIKWLMAKQADGVSISHAVEMWMELVNANMDPLAGSSSTGINPLQISSISNFGTSLDTLRAQWLTACLMFNETTAEQSLNQSFSIFPVETVCVEVLQKGLAEMGELWYGHRASVQQEHFASCLAMRRVDALLSAVPVPWRKQTVLVGCPAGEWHAFVPLLLSLLLRRRGQNVIHLGVNVPSAQFVETAASVRADLVILVAQRLVTAASLQQAALLFASQDVTVAFGGRIFTTQPVLVESIPAHYLGETLVDSLEEVERLLKRTSKNAASVRSITRDYVAAHQFFTSRRTQIESTLQTTLQLHTVSPHNLASGILHLGDNIAAALQLGDMGYASSEIEWLKSLINADDRSSQELVVFLQAYANAVKKNIDGSGRPIHDWLSTEMERLRNNEPRTK